MAELSYASGLATTLGPGMLLLGDRNFSTYQFFTSVAGTGIAARQGVSPTQAILRWHLQQGRIIIPKSVTPQRIRENLDVFGFDLTADELSVLDGLERDGRTGPGRRSSTADNFRGSVSLDHQYDGGRSPSPRR